MGLPPHQQQLDIRDVRSARMSLRPETEMPQRRSGADQGKALARIVHPPQVSG